MNPHDAEALILTPWEPKPGIRFGLSGIFDWTQVGDSDPDSIFLFMTMPRISKTNGRFTYWAGVGLGLSVVSFSKTGTAVDNFYVSTGSDSFSGFAVSPRVGFDLDIESDFSIGAYFSFTNSVGSFDGNVRSRSSGGSVSFSDTVNVNWVGCGVRGGLSF